MLRYRSNIARTPIVTGIAAQNPAIPETAAPTEQAEQKPKKVYEPKIEEENVTEEGSSRAKNDEEEKTDKGYSFLTGKTKEIVESFNGKVID